MNHTAAQGIGLRLLVSVALLGGLAWHLDLRALGALLTHLHPGWMGSAFLLVLAAVLLSAWKWGLILRARGHAIGLPRLVRHYFVGLFFNNVLPSSIGGDGVRAWEARKDTGETAEAIGSVVTERLIAGVALGASALAGLPFMPPSARLWLLVAAFVALNLTLVLLFVLPRVAESAVRKLLPRQLDRLQDMVARIVLTVRATLAQRGLFARVVLCSVAFQTLVAAVNACIFRAMDLPVDLATCMVYTPMIFALTMLPISISGFGVREAAYGYFFVQAGATQSQAFAASVAFFALVGVASLPGALVFLKGQARSTTRA